MGQAAEHAAGRDTSAVPVSWCRRALCSARYPLSESTMRPPAIVVGDLVGQNVMKMAFVDDHHAVQAFGANRSDPAFGSRFRIELDNDPVERAVRPVALGRKNYLLAGSDGGGEHKAMDSSLITMAKLNSIEPHEYRRDVPQRMVDGHPIDRLDDLLPWKWLLTPVNR